LIAALASRPSRQTAPKFDPPVVDQPAAPSSLESAPPEVREFLNRVLEKIPDRATPVAGYQFWHWEREGKPTQESIGLKAVPGTSPDQLIARVMNVDGYQGNFANVNICRSEKDSAFEPPAKVRFFQVLSIPGIAKIQHELALVDAGTIKGYRVAYWYLLKDKTEMRDPKAGARSEHNTGAWFAAQDVVGYALSSWPKRNDVNAFQWLSLTSGANTMAKKIVEDNIDGMVAWARKHDEVGQPSR
jgi:hypothetical protein